MKLTTTLNRIRACHPCASGWRMLLKHLGEDFDPDAEINLLTVLTSNGVPDMLWTLRATVQDSKQVAAQLAIAFAEQALPIFEKSYPDDQRPRLAIKAARDYLEGSISLDDLEASAAAAYAAASDAATYAAADAADAAEAAAAASGYSTASAGYSTASAGYSTASAGYSADAAAAAADAADASAGYSADAATYAAAYAAGRKKSREAQTQIIRSILEG